MVEYTGEKISFRQLSDEDLVLTHKWLLAPHVKEWYGQGKQTFEDIKKKYTPRIKNEDPTSCFIMLYDGKPIGQIQMYKISDYPEYEKIIQPIKKAAGIDLFIGERDYQNKGLGSIIIKKFLKDFVFVKLDVDTCVIGPNPQNIAAIKAYQKAGFTYTKTVVNHDGEEEYLMELQKNFQE